MPLSVLSDKTIERFQRMASKQQDEGKFFIYTVDEIQAEWQRRKNAT
jgi:translation elongation factor EF-1alpha